MINEIIGSHNIRVTVQFRSLLRGTAVVKDPITGKL